MSFELGNSSVKNGWPEAGRILQCVSYAPQVFGTSGNPLQLGSDARPNRSNDRFAFLAVPMHEMGHNFHSLAGIFDSFAVPGAFYQETLAEWYREYFTGQILKRQSDELEPRRRRFPARAAEGRARLSSLRNVAIPAKRQEVQLR